MRWWMTGLAVWVMGCEAVSEPPASLDAGTLDGGADADARSGDRGVPDRGPSDAAPDRSLADTGPPDLAVDATPGDAAAPLDGGLDAAPVDAGLDEGVDAELDAASDAASVDAELARERACFNGEDDDGDGRVDCADPDCRPAIACIGVPEICDNGVDDNGDDIVDCDDLYCHQDPLCPPLGVVAYTDEELLEVFAVDCAGCHTNGGDDARLRLDEPLDEQLIDVPSAQLAMMRVASGKRDDSYLYYKVRYRHQDAPGGGGGGEGMPPHAPWTAQKVERFGLWIDALDE